MRQCGIWAGLPTYPPFNDYGPLVQQAKVNAPVHEFKFTEAEKEEIRDKTFHAMSDRLDRLFPMFEEVLSKRKGREHE